MLGERRQGRAADVMLDAFSIRLGHRPGHSDCDQEQDDQVVAVAVARIMSGPPFNHRDAAALRQQSHLHGICVVLLNHLERPFIVSLQPMEWFTLAPSTLPTTLRPR
jgi:hypothetical protein